MGLILPPNEAHRLAVLRRLGILDSDPEPAFDAIVQLARQTFGVKTALISLVDAERQWFKAKVGLAACETARDISFCHHALLAPDDVFLVLDAQKDARFRDNPLVTGEPYVRFYAGAPIVLDGAAVGTLCLIDPEPRFSFDRDRRGALAAFATPIAELLRLRLETGERRILARSVEFQARQLTLAEEMAGVGYFIRELETGKLHWSDEVHRILGVPKDTDMSRFDTSMLYDEADRAVVPALTARAIRTGEGFTFKTAVTRQCDGEKRVIQCRAEVRPKEDDLPARLFGVVQDVTEQEALLRKTQESEERYRLLADRSSDMIAVILADSTIRFASPATHAVLGYAAEEMLGWKALELTHPDDIPGVLQFFAKLTAAGPQAEPRPYQFRARAKSGEWVWLEGQPRIEFDEAGRMRLYRDTLRDISQRKALEDALKAARADAESAAQAKSDFLANMSHELRTPLTGILGYADVLKEESAPGTPARRRAELIGQAGRNLLVLVNDVLDLSKIEAGGVVLDPRPVELGACLSAAADLLRGQAEAKGLALVVDLPAQDAWVRIDPERLSQVVTNLVGNAVKFTARGEVRLSLAVHDAAEGRAALTVRVVDTGVGIPQDRLAQVFERFEQADSSTARRFGGTGLGLAISRALVARMGGAIAVRSVVGEGSSFTVQLEAPRCAAPAAAPGALTQACDGLRGLRVLLAEDVAMNRELISIFLAPHGVVLAGVENGAQAVEAAAREAFDLILMDMQMPVMDGLEAARRIRASGGPNAAAPIVALTANVLAEEIGRCAAAGMDGHVLASGEVVGLAQAYPPTLPTTVKDE